MTIHSRWAMALLFFGNGGVDRAAVGHGGGRAMALVQPPTARQLHSRHRERAKTFRLRSATMARSTPPKTWLQWFPRESGVEHTLRATVFFNEQAIVAGDDGILLYSESEEQFEPGKLDKPASGGFRALAASSETIVAGGDDGMLYISTDGQKWRKRTFGYNNHIYALIWTWEIFRRRGRGRSCGHQQTTAVRGPNVRVGPTAILTLWPTSTNVSGPSAMMVSVLLSYNDGWSWLAARSGTDKNLNAVTGTASEVIVAGENVVRKGVLDFFMYWVDLLGNDEGTNPSPPPDWTYYCAIEVDDKFLLGGRTGMLVDSVRDEEDDEYLYWFSAAASVRNWLWDISRVGDLMVHRGRPRHRAD